MAKLPKWIWLLIIGAVLILPMLGSYGLWDPAEIKLADVAQNYIEGQAPKNVQSLLQVWLVGLGFKLFGVNEFAGRFPLALCGLLGLLVAYRVVKRLVDEKAALVASFVFITTPTILFQSRQLTSEIPFFIAILAAIGGLSAYIAPRDKKREILDLVIGTIGLTASIFAKGLLIGLGIPLIVFGVALPASYRLFATVHLKDSSTNDEEDAETEESTEALYPSLNELYKPLAIALGLAALVVLAVMISSKYGKFLLLGATYRKVGLPPTFEKMIGDLGFSLYPWVAFLPLMIWSFVVAQYQSSRDAFIKLVIVIAMVFSYLVAYFWPGYFGSVPFPALSLLLVGIGIWVWQAYESKTQGPIWALVATGLILVMHQDFFVEPDKFAFSHLFASAKYPEKELSIRIPIRIFGLAMAFFFFFSVGGMPQKIQKEINTRFGWLNSILGRVVWFLNFIGDWMRQLAGENRKHLFIASAISIFLFAGWSSLWLTPNLSLHMSNKALFDTYKQCKKADEQLAQYRVPGRSAEYYNDGKVERIGSQNDLFKKLRQPQRIFVLIPANNLGSIDQAARKQKVNYHVLDDRNSRYLIVSNQLGGAVCQEDKNPLRKLVLKSAPKPKHRANVIWENKVQLIGYDVPDRISRGGSFTIKLYFKVLKRMPANYDIFMHIDKPASRIHGDHKPLDGKYPTQYWLPGDYIVDPKEIDLPRLTTSAGRYNIMMGFWRRGAGRLKIVKGPNDRSNRANIGPLVVH